MILALAAVTLLVWRPWRRDKRPNIVVIVADTLRADHLPFYGYDRIETPYLSGLAGRSILFKHAWSTSSWTAPATASLFTSLYPFQHGVIHNFRSRIPEEAVTLAEILKESGYRTFGVSLNIMVSNALKFDQGFDRFVTILDKKNAEYATRQLLKWEKEIKESSPYFVYIHYMDCHRPYPRWAPWYRKQAEYFDDLLAAYDSSISYLDDQIRRLAERFNWKQNTLIVFTSDHGEEFMEHGRQGHGVALFRETIQVPLMFHLPDGSDSRKVQDNVSLVDVLPTIREILGLPQDPAGAGRSLADFWRDGAAAPQDRYIFSHLVRLVKRGNKKDRFRLVKLREIGNTAIKSSVARAVISGKWHMISTIFPEQQLLYDWQADPLETSDVWQEELIRAHRLKEYFLEFEAHSRKFRPDIKLIDLDADKIRELKTLGYL